MLRKGKVSAEAHSTGTPKEGTDEKQLGHPRDGTEPGDKEPQPESLVPPWSQRKALLPGEKVASCRPGPLAAHQRACPVLNPSCVPGKGMTKCILTEMLQVHPVCYPQRNSVSLKCTLNGLHSHIWFIFDMGSGCGGGF